MSQSRKRKESEMSRLVVQVVRQESSVATAIVELGPGQPVRHSAPDRVVEGVLRMERPLPMAALVRQVLTRYGLELAVQGETDCQPCEEIELPCELQRGSLRA
jgi:hypothetical protein